MNDHWHSGDYYHENKNFRWLHRRIVRLWGTISLWRVPTLLLVQCPSQVNVTISKKKEVEMNRNYNHINHFVDNNNKVQSNYQRSCWPYSLQLEGVSTTWTTWTVNSTMLDSSIMNMMCWRPITLQSLNGSTNQGSEAILTVILRSLQNPMQDCMMILSNPCKMDR